MRRFCRKFRPTPNVLGAHAALKPYLYGFGSLGVPFSFLYTNATWLVIMYAPTWRIILSAKKIAETLLQYMSTFRTRLFLIRLRRTKKIHLLFYLFVSEETGVANESTTSDWLWRKRKTEKANVKQPFYHTVFLYLVLHFFTLKFCFDVLYLLQLNVAIKLWMNLHQMFYNICKLSTVVCDIVLSSVVSFCWFSHSFLVCAMGFRTLINFSIL